MSYVFTGFECHFFIELIALTLTLIKGRLADKNKYHFSAVGTIQQQPRLQSFIPRNQSSKRHSQR